MSTKAKIITAMMIMICCIAAIPMITAAEDLEAAGSGTQQDPYTSISVQQDPYTSISVSAANSTAVNGKYVAVGAPVSITAYDDYPTEVITITGVTAGYGLTASGGNLTGTVSQTGTISITAHHEDEDVYDITWTLYAVNAAPATYTVSFSAGTGGSVSQSTISNVPSGASITVSSNQVTINGTTVTATPSQDYHFLSWSNTSGTVTANRTITANFEHDTTTYYLYYNANGGSGAPSTQSGTTIASSYSFTVSNTAPTRSGYNFLGWADSSDATVAQYTGGSSITLYRASPSKTIYAVWSEIPVSTTYTLSYDANNGTGAPSAQTGTTIASSYSFTVSNTAPTRSGYNFLGWADSSDATVAQYTGGSSITLYRASPTKTIYAVWAEIFNYSLEYDANSGIDPPSTQTHSGTETSYTFTLYAGEPTRSGYTFLGWADSDTAVAADYVGCDTITLQSSAPTKTIYAVWSEIPVAFTYTLTYDANGGSGEPSAETQITSALSQSFTISNTVPTLAGYDFLGWADSNTATVADYVSGSTIVLTSTAPTKTIYAVWVEHSAQTYTYTLNFNGNGGSGTPVTMTATGTSLSYSFTIPDVKPTKEGSVFVGWSLAASATSASYSPGATIIVGADQEITLFAVWNDDNGFSFSFDYLIKQIANTFFGGSTSLAGLSMIIVAWLLIIAVLANMGASPVYSVAPMIPIVIIFAAMGIVSTDVTMLLIIICAILSAIAVRNVVKGD